MNPKTRRTEDSPSSYGQQPSPPPLHIQRWPSMLVVRRSQPRQPVVSVTDDVLCVMDVDMLTWAVCGGIDSPSSKPGIACGWYSPFRCLSNYPLGFFTRTVWGFVMGKVWQCQKTVWNTSVGADAALDSLLVLVQHAHVHVLHWLLSHPLNYVGEWVETTGMQVIAGHSEYRRRKRINSGQNMGTTSCYGAPRFLRYFVGGWPPFYRCTAYRGNNHHGDITMYILQDRV
jgi:hypothetical protein